LVFLFDGCTAKIPPDRTSRVQSTRTPSPFSSEVEYFVARKARTESPISVRAFRPLQLTSYRRPKASPMEQQLAPALGRLRILLEEASTALHIPVTFALIDGPAISAWGAVRATQDIDLLADSDPGPISDRDLRDTLAKFLANRTCAIQWRIGAADDPIPLPLKLGLPGARRRVGADILWAQRRWHQDALRRRLEIPLGRSHVFVLHPEDLILMKSMPAGPRTFSTCRHIRRLKRSAARIRLKQSLDRCLPKKNR